MINFKKYIGIPYKHLGRSFEFADCWGLIWLIYKEERNIILPDNLTYKEFWYNDENITTNYLLNGFGGYENKIEISPPFEIFDILLFWNQKRTEVDHVGMYTETDRFIHTYRNNTSKINRLRGYWNTRLYKGIRWQK